MSTWFTSTPESEALLAEERLVLAATEMVYEAMELKGVSKKELASLMGLSPSEVSQRLSGRRNLTLRSLARMLHTLGGKADLTLAVKDELVGSASIHQSRRIEQAARNTYVPAGPRFTVLTGGAAA